MHSHPTMNAHPPNEKQLYFNYTWGTEHVLSEHAPRALGEKAPEDRQETAETVDQAHMPCPGPEEKKIAGIWLRAALNTQDSS